MIKNDDDEEDENDDAVDDEDDQVAAGDPLPIIKTWLSKYWNEARAIGIVNHLIACTSSYLSFHHHHHHPPIIISF